MNLPSSTTGLIYLYLLVQSVTVCVCNELPAVPMSSAFDQVDVLLLGPDILCWTGANPIPYVVDTSLTCLGIDTLHQALYPSTYFLAQFRLPSIFSAPPHGPLSHPVRVLTFCTALSPNALPQLPPMKTPLYMFFSGGLAFILILSYTKWFARFSHFLLFIFH